MAWLEITISVPQGQAEEAAQALTAAGFCELVIEDEAQFESFLEENRAYWDYIDEALQERLRGLSAIRLYLEDTDASGLAALEETVARLGYSLERTLLPEENWEESWKENYQPLNIGRRLCVVPCWQAEAVPEGRLPVILDPGLTFGTGEHPSTRMVLEALENTVQPGHICLDLGSGSGILSIAALRLGAAQATGVDIDPKAEAMARENAAFNGYCAPAFTALTGNVLTDTALMRRLAAQKADVVLVNIVADVIIALAPVLPEFLQARSTLICSGILDTRLAEVLASLEGAGLAVTQIKELEQWRCLTAQRRTQ